MNSGITILSLFDGMSCGQQALDRLGVKVDAYYASEIDKHAMTVTMANYPNTIQLGSVTEVDGYKLPKIDILMGGSPCQSFSFAGKRKGMATKCEQEILTLEQYLELKADGFEFEGQSYLFWEYMRLLKEVKPRYFLLENVMMGEKWERVLSKAIGVNPIEINAALVSAQNRRRLYWTNIGMEPRGLFGDMESIIQQPKDRGILLKDILELEVDAKYFLSEKAIKSILLNQDNLQKSNIDPLKSNPLQSPGNACGIYKGASYIVASRGRNPDNPKSRQSGLKTEQMLEARHDGKTNTITSVQKDNLVIQINPSKESQGQQPFQQNRIYDTNGISPALMAQLPGGGHKILIPMFTGLDKNAKSRTLRTGGHQSPTQKHNFDLISDGPRIRRLTPTECERLQTVNDGYTAHVSDTQRYRMLGNGWCVEVIVHILSYGDFPKINEINEQETQK